MSMSKLISLFGVDGAETFIDAFSGAFGATISTMIFYPLDNIRTRLQAYAKSETDTTDEEMKAGGYAQHKQKEKFDSFKIIMDIFKKEGVFAFYRGIETALFGNFMSSGIYFFWYRFWKNVVEGLRKGPTQSLDILLVSLLAGIISVLATSPIWVINARLSVQNKEEKETFIDIVKSIYKKEGIKGFYKGLTPALILVSNPIIYFFVYEWLIKKGVFGPNSKDTLTILLNSSVSKAIATFFTYPYLTIKTKMQINRGKNMSTTELLYFIIKSDGYSSLYRGILPKLAQTIMFNAFLMITYEKIRMNISTVLRKLVQK